MQLFTRIIRKLRRDWKKLVRLRKARHAGLQYEPPNFVFDPCLSTNSVVVDVGCSYEADFSLYMIDRFGAKSFAVDPTLKHRPALEKLQADYKGQLDYVPAAICASDGTIKFTESKTNESGSLMQDHINVKNDETISYDVEAISLKSLRQRLGVDKIDIIKLDLEGAEYDLLNQASREELLPFNQIFVEFHHHAVASFSEFDTQQIVNRLANFGYQTFSLDDHNYLFKKSA